MSEPKPRLYLVSLAGSAALAGAAFLPWLSIGAVGLPGIPDPAGFFVLAVGLLGALASGAGLVRRADTHPWLVLAGLAGVTTLLVVWITGPGTIAERAQARAEAVALVDNVPLQPVPPVRFGVGLILGHGGALALTAPGIAGVARGRREDS